MQWRPLCKNQGCGDRQNSNPISPNLRRLGPKKRIGPEHVTTPEYSDPASWFRIESQNQRLLTSGSARGFWAGPRTFSKGYFGNAPFGIRINRFLSARELGST